MDFLNQFINHSKCQKMNGYRSVDQLTIGKSYKVLDFNFTTTTYGRQVLMTVENEGDIILPGRISNMVKTSEQLNIMKEGIDQAIPLGKQSNGKLDWIIVDFKPKNEAEKKSSSFQ